MPNEPSAGALKIDFKAVNACPYCSERYGLCGHHQKLYGVDYQGRAGGDTDAQ